MGVIIADIYINKHLHLPTNTCTQCVVNSLIDGHMLLINAMCFRKFLRRTSMF